MLLGVETLFHLCLQQIAVHFVEGNADKFSKVRLPEYASNALFEKVGKHMKSQSTIDALTKLDKHLQLSKLKIRCSSDDVLSRPICHQPDLTSLSIDCTGCFDVTMIIENIVEQSPQSALSHLSLTGTRWKFPEWPLSNSVTLANLSHLTVWKIQTSAKTFKLICNTASNLRHLCFGFVKLYSLNGISKTKNLEILTLQDVKFLRSANPFADLCQLKELRVLEMSKCGDGPSQNVVKFVTALLTTSSVPPLEVLDCTNTEIDVELFKTILEKLPTLSTAILFGTPLENTTFLEGLVERQQKITVLNSTSLTKLLQGVQHYRENCCLYGHLLRRILDYLTKKHKLSKGEVRAVFSGFEKIFEQDGTEFVKITQSALLQLFRFGRHEALDPDQIRLCFAYFSKHGIATNSNEELEQDFWTVLDTTNLMNVDHLTIGFLCTAGLWRIRTLLREDMEKVPAVLRVVNKVYSRVGNCHESINNDENMRGLLVLIDVSFKEDRAEDFWMAVELLQMFTRRSAVAADNFMESTGVLTVFFVIPYTRRVDIHVELLVILRNVAQLMTDPKNLNDFREGDRFQLFFERLDTDSVGDDFVNGRSLSTERMYLLINIMSVYLSMSSKKLLGRPIYKNVNKLIKQYLTILPTSRWTLRDGFPDDDKLAKIMNMSLIDGPKKFVKWTMAHKKKMNRDEDMEM